MKKLLAFFAFLLLGAMPVSASQGNLSQFSVRSRKQNAAQQASQKSARASATARAHSARPHPYTSNPPVSPVGFVSALQIPAGGAPYWTAVTADFNNDGKHDLATPVLNDDGVTFSVSVVLSNGDGTFQSPILTPNPNGSYGDQILVGDVNNDGFPDLIVVHATKPSTFEVWLWEPTTETFNVQGNALNQIAPYDLDGGVLIPNSSTGNLDLVAIDSQTPANVWTLAGSGTGSFSPATSVALTGGQLNNIVFDYFNNDGIIDFAATDSANNNQTVVYLGQASGAYVAGTPLTASPANYGTCNNSSGDLNGDGMPEIVSANCGFDDLIIYVNNGNGTFQPGVTYAFGTNSPYLLGEAVTIADVNGDGKNDIISSNFDGGDVTVMLGVGNGTVQLPAVGYSTGGSPHTSALVADFNGDGFMDIVVPDDNFSFAYLPGYGDGTFRAAMDFFSPVPDTGRAFSEVIASADLNGDGYPDLVVGNCCDGGITVFLSQPDGSLGPGVIYGSNESLTSVAIADFNGDGILDIAALDLGSPKNGVQIFFGIPKTPGMFSLGGSYFTGGSGAGGIKNGAFNQIVARDFNQDGHIDIAVADYASNDVSVLLNDGTGAFPNAVTYSFSNSGNAQTIATADVNNDGFYDLIVTNYGSTGVVNVLLGQAGGIFAPAKNSPITFAFNYPGNIALGDLNGDGNLDLVVTVDDATKGTGLAVAQGNGDGTFQTAVLFPTTLQDTRLNQVYPGDVKIFDLNGDGDNDLVYSNASFGTKPDYGTVGVLYNTGTNPFALGMFYDPVEYAAGSVVYSLALADVNNDGAMDVVMADDFYAGVTVMLNGSGSGSTVASSANPAIVGTSVSFTANVAATVRGITAVPTGTVTFLDGSTSLGTAALTAGAATFTTTGLAVGTHSITVQYGGDSNFHSSTSKLLSEVVGKPDFSLSPSSASASITAGASATFTITSTPVYGYTGTIEFSATGCPSKATCTFSPASVSLAGTAGVPTTLTISTAAATTSFVTPFHPNSNPIDPTLWASLGGFGLFGMILAGTGKKRSRRMAVVVGMLVLMITITFVGCGGGSSSSSTTPGTPAGSYPVTVTATGSGTNASTHTLNITVVVQ
ncbi:MAG: FG-GAP-like repeat-containing protein [Candidatus Sulfotelmatobacter sp.]